MQDISKVSTNIHTMNDVNKRKEFFFGGGGNYCIPQAYTFFHLYKQMHKLFKFLV